MLLIRWLTLLFSFPSLSLPSSAVRKINELVKRVRTCKVHAYIISHLKEQMPMMMGFAKKQKEVCRIRQTSSLSFSFLCILFRCSFVLSIYTDMSVSRPVCLSCCCTCSCSCTACSWHKHSSSFLPPLSVVRLHNLCSEQSMIWKESVLYSWCCQQNCRWHHSNCCQYSYRLLYPSQSAFSLSSSPLFSFVSLPVHSPLPSSSFFTSLFSIPLHSSLLHSSQFSSPTSLSSPFFSLHLAHRQPPRSVPHCDEEI